MYYTIFNLLILYFIQAYSKILSPIVPEAEELRVLIICTTWE